MAIPSISKILTPVEKLKERGMIESSLEGLEGGNSKGSFNFSQKVADDMVEQSQPTSQPTPQQSLSEAITNFSPEEAADALGQDIAVDALDTEIVTGPASDPRFEVRDVFNRPLDYVKSATRDEYDRKEVQRDEDGLVVLQPKIFRRVPANSETYTDGGIQKRADKMTSLVEQGILGIGLSGHGTSAYTAVKAGVVGPELSTEISKYSEGDLLSAISRAGNDSITTNPSGFKIPNPMYTEVASLVVENAMFNILGNESQQTKDALEEAMGQESLLEKGAPIAALSKVTQTTGNNMIGQEIHLEYIRAKNATLKAQGVPEGDPMYQEARRIETREAETLGAAFKHLWAEANPELVRKFTGEDRQTVYALTPQGEAVMELGSLERKKFFPRQLVRPLKAKNENDISKTDVGRNVARYISGGKSGQKMGFMMQEAIKNLSSIAQVVDKQRMKILMATSLNILASNDTQAWEAEISGVGSTALDKFAASKSMQDRRFQADARLKLKERVYDPEGNMNMKRNKLANEVRALAQDHASANYLSWNIQGYQGRLTPQQSHFNPTTSKQVRFATRGVNPVNIKIGSRQERNLRQMFAMLLIPQTFVAGSTQAEIKGKTATVLNQAGDTYLPDQRDFLLTQKSNELYGYGARLTSLMAISDTDYDNIIEAITNGVPLDNPAFPKVNGFNLNPESESDQRLIKLITKNGDDATIYIDALMEFKKYMDFKNGVTNTGFTTYLNAYIDGKTNGPASNAMLLGKSDTAFLTGVMRSQGISNLDNGDMRDRLIGLASESIFTEGWSLAPEKISSMDNIAMEVFANRDLAKYTIMTFGYGKEIESFGKYIQEVIEVIRQTNIRQNKEAGLVGPTQFELDLANAAEAYKQSDTDSGLPELAGALNSRYAKSIKEVLGDEPIEARSLMRAIAAKHAMMNEPFIITGPSGMQIHIGGEASTGYDNADMSTYKLSPQSLSEGEFEKVTVASYNKEATAAAPKNQDGKQIPGELAYGGSAVAPIQAIDAAVVMMTASGESFKRLTAASGGLPYMHTIYDAFKMDANGYDVMLEEVNKNWEKATLNWSYLEQAKISLEAATKRFNEKMSKLDDSAEVTANEAVYMQHMLKVSVNKKTGKKQMANIVSRIGKFMNSDSVSTSDVSNDLRLKMQVVGYNVHNPPAKPNVRQLRMFVREMDYYFGSADPEYGGSLNTRLNRMIKQTNANKIQLKKDLKKFGYTLPNGQVIAMQYFGH